VQQAAAKPLPGAVEFLRYAASRGVTIFYVTNRDSASEAATRENLIKDDFAMTPGIDNVLLVGEHGWNSEKAGRRMFVAEHYRIVMLMGDDLGDFIAGVRDSTDEGRVAAAQAHRERWGKQWIILPNPTYGGWESALFKGVTPKPDDAGKLKVKYGKLEQMR